MHINYGNFNLTSENPKVVTKSNGNDERSSKAPNYNGNDERSLKAPNFSVYTTKNPPSLWFHSSTQINSSNLS